MRLWHYQLLPLLDDFHIVAQWRELLAIKGAIDKNGTPNHRLVNKVLDYGIVDFKKYCVLVVDEMKKRNIKHSTAKRLEMWNWHCNLFKTDFNEDRELYDGWHNHRYLTQCFFNLQEKADCGIVSKQAWARIDKFYWEEMTRVALPKGFKSGYINGGNEK